MTDPAAIGTPLPDFALPLADGGVLDPAALAGAPAVLFFYPRDDTPGCTTEAKAFSALLPRFAAAGGTRVFGISKDSPDTHRRFIARHALAVPLASDSAAGGLSDALGFWGEKRLYGKTYQGMIRSTVLIDAGGRIAQVWTKVRVAGHAEAVLAAAEAL